MSEQLESKRKQGPVTVLTLLFGLLIGLGGAPVQAQADPGTARLGTGEIIRTGAGLRVARSGEEEPDDDSAVALLPPPPRIVTELASARPVAATAAASVAAFPAGGHSPYQARAPPAA